MEFLVERGLDWLILEPFVAVLMLASTAALFISHFNGSGVADSMTSWIRRLVESLAVAAGFMFLLWTFRAILNDNYSQFGWSHGRVSEHNYASVQSIWGGPLAQGELSVEQTVTKEYVEEIVREDPTLPRLYRREMRTEVVAANQIAACRGDVLLTINKRKKGTAFYPGYQIVFHMQYTIRNSHHESTLTKFSFPLQPDHMYEDLDVLENGKSLSGQYSFNYEGGIEWARLMSPGDELTVDVRYVSRGLESFYYQIPVVREIRNFDFKIEVVGLPVDNVNYPENCLTPDTVLATTDGGGSILRWNLDRAVTTNGLGVALERPTQPGEQVRAVLQDSPYALVLLVTAVAITLLICGQPVRFLDLTLLGAAYCLVFWCMASLHDYFLGFIGAWLVGAALSLGITFLLIRRHEVVFVTRAVFGLVAFFVMVYPLGGLLADAHDDFQVWVSIGLVLYIFLIALRARRVPTGNP